MYLLPKSFTLKAGLFILLFTPLSLKAQYSNTIVTNATPNYIYVGSLNYLSSDGSNYQKIQVDVLGGGWSTTGMGVTTYYIGNRGGMVVNRVTMGSSNDNIFTLQAYSNTTNNNIDFYLVTNYWAAFAIKAAILQGSGPVSQLVTITSSTSVPTGTPVAVTINPVMITDASGNIGIGTINPNGYKLAVKGTIHSQQVNVDMNNWADYVFGKDYTLPTLASIKTYIDQNHHLPEIPSAQQIEKDGLNLGEMNKLLVKKVEELTLYLIQLREEKDKREKDQEQRIQNLEQQVKELINSKKP
jgi:hypothetical protein